MLPDLRKVKAELQKVHMQTISALAQKQLGAFSDIPRHIIHEGDSMVTLRADGTSEQSGMSTVSAESSIDAGRVAKITADERYEILADLARRMAEGMATQLYGELNRTLEDAGQVVEGKGKGFTPELFLEVLEKIEMEFDDAGQMKNMRLVMHPDSKLDFAKVQRQLDTDPGLQQRYNDIMQRKREAYYAREAARELVG
ncbi:hypothetical protein ACGFZ3_13445 [Stenotrophomonas sp. NPDC047960]|uniref:hypothetical protein n=1 Tax=Stenotrophomonas sp. NPDC047960 TaxID=3364531 RepID=UPI0037208F09